MVHQYPPHFLGGTELYTQTLAKNQASAGHDVHVLSPFPGDLNGQDVHLSEEEGVQVIRVGLKPRSRSQVFLHSFRQQDLQDAVKKVLFEVKPDIIHIQHLMGMPLGLVDLIVANEIPYIVTLHDYWYVCANAQLLTNTDRKICSGPDRLFLNCARCALARTGSTSMGWLAPGAAPLMGYRNRQLSRILDQAMKIIAPTQFVRRIYSELGAAGSKLTVIRHGLELPEEKITAARTKRSRKQPEGPLQIGYIGGISWQKGLHILIAAVNGFDLNEVVLSIYGNLASFPDYVQELEKLIKGGNVNLAGSIEHEQIWSKLAGFDVLVLPTLWYETSSLILDEAFAVGVPVIAAQIGVMEEKIDDGKNGRLFPIGDSGALQEILQEIMDNKHILKDWQENIPTVRTIDVHMKEIEDVYDEVLHGI